MNTLLLRGVLETVCCNAMEANGLAVHGFVGWSFFSSVFCEPLKVSETDVERTCDRVHGGLSEGAWQRKPVGRVQPRPRWTKLLQRLNFTV